MEAAHSKLGASSYYRWGASLGGCPGSVRESEGIESESSTYAAEGTLAHDLAAHDLMGQPRPGPVVDSDMEEAIAVYTGHVANLRAMKPSFEAVEQKFHLADLHPKLYGTADYVCHFSRIKTLHVVDYKHGAGIPVEVVENGRGNPQLLYYGLGALCKTGVPVEKVVLTIVQPRCYHPDGPIRSFEFDAVEILDFAAQLVDDALATENPKAPLLVGDHCRFCPAQPTCRAVEETALAEVKHGLPAVERYDDERLGRLLSLIPQIQSWCTNVREYAYRKALAGYPVPGHKLVDKRAMRHWNEDPQLLDFLFKELPLSAEQVFEKKLKSPAAIEKLLPKEMRPALDKYVVKESSGKTLVPVGDSREPAQDEIAAAFDLKQIT